MGALGAAGKEPEDSLMEEKMKNAQISPFRMSQMVKTASDISERLVAGKFLYNPTWQECEIIINMVSMTIQRCKEANQDVLE